MRIAAIGDDRVDCLAVVCPDHRLAAGTGRATHAGIADGAIEILAEAGYSLDEIQALIASGAAQADDGS